MIARLNGQKGGWPKGKKRKVKKKHSVTVTLENAGFIYDELHKLEGAAKVDFEKAARKVMD